MAREWLVNGSKFQEQLVAFLRLPGSYPHRPDTVRPVQTHISWVFIAPPFVFKVKKPVNLGFLDFSTLEKRRYFCEREVELNRRLAPEVYLGVVRIYKTASGFSFEGEGEIVEHSVKMRELPHDGFLSELLAKGLVGEPEIDRVVLRLHRFYQSETPKPEIEQWGTPEKLKISTDENFAQVEPFIGKTISAVAFEAIQHFTNQFYVANEKLFFERIQQHRILDCHGDLHLDHIHLSPEATTIFDCIEFNDRFRFIDIANDLAFLAMDFDFERRRDLGNLLLRNAARDFGDSGMLKIANFYKCYRAFVRGKVGSIQASEPETVRPEEHRKQAARYFRLALQYAVAGSESLVLVVMGRVGTGKTTIAKQLASELGWRIFSSDEIRKTLACVPLTERTPPELRDKLYSEQMTMRTYKKLVENGLGPLATHSGVILDATFSSGANRDFLREQCAKANVRLQVVELHVDLEQIKNRLRARDNHSSETSDARLEDLEKLSAAYEPLSELVADLIKVSASGSASDTVKAVLFQLAEKSVSRTDSFCGEQ
ncbi:MAG: phosphotransferase [Verrucomicrobia bacterium]|nr:MAG: phosphotransferase [Verrucomicrobiota bacterium]